MTTESVNAASVAFKKALIERALGAELSHHAPVYIGSPRTRANLWDAVNNRTTVFWRELEMLRAAGYKQVGDYMLPLGAR